MAILAWILLGIMSFVLVALFFYLLFNGAVYHFIFSRNSKLKKQIEKKKNSPEEINFWDRHGFKDVQICSHDALKLFGKYFSNSSNYVALLVHGYGGNYVDMAKFADIFLKRGFDVLAVDNRAHGKSGGDTVGMGWVDRLDVADWCEFLAQKNSRYSIVLFGQSMGASAVCNASAQQCSCKVLGIIEDCGFDNTFRQVCHVYNKCKAHPKLLLKMFVKFANRKNGYDMKQADCIKQLKKTSLSLLVIHGSDDDFVPTEMGYNIYHSLEEKRRSLYIAKGAKHTESYDVDKKKYISVVNRFLDKIC